MRTRPVPLAAMPTLPGHTRRNHGSVLPQGASSMGLCAAGKRLPIFSLCRWVRRSAGESQECRCVAKAGSQWLMRTNCAAGWDANRICQRRPTSPPMPPISLPGCANLFRQYGGRSARPNERNAWPKAKSTVPACDFSKCWLRKALRAIAKKPISKVC